MVRVTVATFTLTVACIAQNSQGQSADRMAPAEQATDKRLFGIIPNYRTSPSLANYKALTAKEKFKLASQDAFDRGTFLLAAAFAGKDQLTNASPSFGQGAKGYAHYFVTSYADWAIGDYMTEAIFPTLVHQDPRYFRRGNGRALSRLSYAMGQIFLTHNDSGHTTFNLSEIGGNASAVAISQAYRPDNRDAASAGSALAVQIGVDMASNIMKEFYPDLRRALSRKHRSAAPTH
jgi:hypothetical protein